MDPLIPLDKIMVDDMGKSVERACINGDVVHDSGALTVSDVNQLISDLANQMHGNVTEFRCAVDMIGLLRHHLLSANLPEGEPGPFAPIIPVVEDDSVPPGWVKLVRYSADPQYMILRPEEPEVTDDGPR